VDQRYGLLEKLSRELRLYHPDPLLNPDGMGEDGLRELARLTMEEVKSLE